MFTGLIEDIGELVRLERTGGGATLTVSTQLPTAQIKLGDSIAVNGACLTVTRKTSSQLSFDLSLESLDRTALGALGSGEKVHLERAMQLGARIDGHLVQGHIDGTATVVGNTKDGDGWRLSYALPAALLGQVVEKGSIAIDGVSLTIASLVGDRVSVAVVPHTARMTLLTHRPLGAKVNIETDILGKYVERILTLGRSSAHGQGAAAGGSGGGVTMALLAENGWLK